METLQLKYLKAINDLKLIKERYSKLIFDLENAYMERKVWRDNNSPFIIKSELNKMRMAYAFVKGEADKYDFNLRQATKFKSDEVLNYYVINDNYFQEFFGGTPASYILDKKNIKELPEYLLKDVWIKSVNKSKTEKGYNQWLKEVNVNELCETFGNRLYNVNEPKLKLKNIIVILPKNFHHANANSI